MLFGIVFLSCMLPKKEAHAAEGSPYYGISIDGDFSDWASVQKVPGADGVNETAFVFDGDYLYVYIEEPSPFSATWSGSHSNGKFAFVTDLGYSTLFQLIYDKETDHYSVAGVEGVLCAHSDAVWGLASTVSSNDADAAASGYYWEIAIPASNLGLYNETVSFGHYLAESMYVCDVANISGGGSADGDSGKTEEGANSTPSIPGGSFSGIVYDGSYDDWLYYPHELIEYAGAGTQENVPDAEAALYSADGILYGHVVTYMPAHLNEGGGEFTSGISIQLNKIEVNDDWSNCFWPAVVAVDAEGNINYTPQLINLPCGTYEFCFIDGAGGKSATNISQWTDPMEPYTYGENAVYGRMLVTVGPSKNEMEYWMDVASLANKFNMEADNVKTLSAQYSRIGQQWVTTAGTSTGPVLGVMLCMAVVACSVIRKRWLGAGKTV